MCDTIPNALMRSRTETEDTLFLQVQTAVGQQWQERHARVRAELSETRIELSKQEAVLEADPEYARIQADYRRIIGRNHGLSDDQVAEILDGMKTKQALVTQARETVRRLEGELGDLRDDEGLARAEAAFLAGEAYGFRKGLAAFAAIMNRPEAAGATRETAALLIASLLTDDDALHAFVTCFVGGLPDDSPAV